MPPNSMRAAAAVGRTLSSRCYCPLPPRMIRRLNSRPLSVTASRSAGSCILQIASSVWILWADGGYGRPAIHELEASLSSTAVPAVTIGWARVVAGCRMPCELYRKRFQPRSRRTVIKKAVRPGEHAGRGEGKHSCDTASYRRTSECLQALRPDWPSSSLHVCYSIAWMYVKDHDVQGMTPARSLLQTTLLNHDVHR
jgi:hypothetical protein